METAFEKRIMRKLEELQAEVEYIKEHMVDVDILLTPEEELVVEEALEAYRTGNTVSLEELKRELEEKE